MKLYRVLASASATLALTGAALVAAPAQAEIEDPSADAATWLAAQVPDGELFVSESDFGPFTDYGLNLDISSTLRDLGDEATANALLANVEEVATEYTDAFGTRYSGALGKLAVAMYGAGEDPTNLNGRDLIAELAELQAESGQLMNQPTDGFENNISQAFGARALTEADNAGAAKATEFLADQQCADGGFPQSPGDATCTSTVDATAYSLIALKEIGGYDADVAEGVAYLSKKQAASGALMGSDEESANSAGLAAQAFEQNDLPGGAGSAVAWLETVQVAGGPEKGAIAPGKSGHTALGSNALTDLKRDAFVRATAQSAAVLDLALPAKTFDVEAPTTYQAAGRVVPVKVSGAEPGEKITVALSGGETVNATADESGQASLSPKSKSGGIRTAFVKTPTTGRGSSAAKIKILAAKSINVNLRYSVKKVNQNQLTAFSGLQPGERVRIYYNGKKITDAKASETGFYRQWFNVGGSTGTKKVTVLGEFGDRKGSKTFTVVR